MNRFKKLSAAAILALVFLAPAAHLLAQESGNESTPAAQSPEKKAQEVDTNEAYRHSSTVTAFGKALGMNTNQAATAFEVLNFIVLAGVVGFALIKTLPKTFRNRTSAIQKHLVDARVATEEANARMGNVEARLARLDDEIAAMKAQADKDAAADEQRLKAQVEDEKAKILAAAEQEITAATIQARRQLQRYAAELAVDQAARRLVVTPETDRLVVQNFARKLAGDDPKGGQN
jgi:F-type H+-transporting ATPase subunit b